MSSVCSTCGLAFAVALMLALGNPLRAAAPVDAGSGSGPLRICADPNNLPFSNQHLDGFENRIASLLGHALHRDIAYYWLPQRRGFVRSSLNAGHCDVIVGLVEGYDRVRATRPYYRSTFVFVSRTGERPVRSFDDERLRTLRIGIQITGDDYDNPPPAQALAERHLANQVRGFTVYGDYGKADPQRAIVDAVATRQIDTAAVWGPLAGYFANQERPPLQVTPISPQGGTAMPFTFGIVMGVRKDDARLQEQLNAVLDDRQREIETILRTFHVPLVPLKTSTVHPGAGR